MKSRNFYSCEPCCGSQTRGPGFGQHALNCRSSKTFPGRARPLRPDMLHSRSIATVRDTMSQTIFHLDDLSFAAANPLKIRYRVPGQIQTGEYRRRTQAELCGIKSREAKPFTRPQSGGNNAPPAISRERPLKAFDGVWLLVYPRAARRQFI